MDESQPQEGEKTYTITINDDGVAWITTHAENGDLIVTNSQTGQGYRMPTKMPEPSKMSVGGGLLYQPFKGKILLKQPVHEAMTIAALIQSNYQIDSNSTYNRLINNYEKDNLEFLRGIVWNDDPANLLFNNGGLFIDDQDNFSRGTGADWGIRFAAGKIGRDDDFTRDGAAGRGNIIARSHFGDLQFLHSMADNPGEDPHHTAWKIIAWFEIMYKVAIGEIGTGTQLKDLPFIKDLFNDNTFPSDSTTIRTLLTSDHKYNGAKPERRALGSCMHIIQDSYARGHSHREVHDENATPKRFGEILNFHCYKGQDGHKHDEYDFGDVKVEDAPCRDLKIFEKMDGCVDGIYQCSKLINHWMEKTPWETVKAWLQSDVFKVSVNATPSNTEV